VRNNLLEGALLVIAVLFVFLGNLRAGLIVAAAIPLSMLFAFDLMLRAGIAGSLMSLGAIDFGMVVDSSVIMVENSVRHLAEDRAAEAQDRHRPRRGARGPQADDVRRADHHDRLPARSSSSKGSRGSCSGRWRSR
jgi:Cu/Ag efflux pump CusA